MTQERVLTKLGLGFAGLLVLQLIVSASSLLRMGDLSDRLRLITEVTNAKTYAVNQVEVGASARAIAARNLVIVVDPAIQRAGVERVQAAQADIDAAFAKLDTLIREDKGATAEERGIYAEARANEAKYRPIAFHIVDLAIAGRRDEAMKSLTQDCMPLLTQVQKNLTAFDDLMKKESTASLAVADEAFRTSRMVILTLTGFSLACGAVLSWLLTRSIARPLGEAVHVARSVATGDLTLVITADRQDEVGQLLAALSDMNANLGKIVGDVRSSTDAIAIASREIAAGNQDLSRRTEEQASSLEKTASSMEELTSTVKQNAGNAMQANQLAAGASAVAVRGGAVVGQVVTTMSSINESSKEIVDIIGVIDGIAFQTNILALNAAVEAARAGEQGRGFAVVASEVRTLAQRSAAAAKEIKKLISDSVSKVEDGTRLVDEAGKTMDEIVTSVKRVTDIMAEITAASQEQGEGIGQVNQAVTQMDAVTQQNAALVEEAAAAAESMQQQAQSLLEAVSTFRLAGGPAPRASAAAPVLRRSTVVANAAPARDAAKTAAVRPTDVVARAPAMAGGDDAWSEF